jgi:hypothetical protein
MSAGQVDEAAVYHCTGNPLPKDIETIVHALLNEKFVDVYGNILDMQINKGLALTDIVQQLHPCVLLCKASLDATWHLFVWQRSELSFAWLTDLSY